MIDFRHDDQWMQVLSAYADGECDRHEEAAVRQHLRDCAECREWLQQAKADREVFRRALLSSAQGIDLSGRVDEEIAKMPTPQKPQEQMPIGAPVARPGGVAVLRITAIEVAAILLIVFVLAAILFPVFARAREKARQSSCSSNLKQIALAAQVYAQENDDRLPDAVRWPDQLEPYAKNRMLYRCPADDSGAEVSYAMNPRYSGASLREYPDPAERVLFYDADESGRPANRHNGGITCAFLDGHVKWLNRLPEEPGPTSGVIPPQSGYGIAQKLKLAYTASAEVWVESIQPAIMQAEKAVMDRGGFVLLSEMQAQTEPYSAQLSGRVPTGQVTNAINDLAKLGWVARRTIQGEDLTRSYLDNTRKVQVHKGRQERLDKAVSQAVTAKHVVELENNLAGAEEAEVTAHSELYGIADRTTLASITATLTQRDRESRPPSPIVASMQGALGALRATGLALAGAAIWLLAFVWVWLPLLWLGLRAARRRAELRAA